MKDYNNLFGKSYSTRPGGSLSDKCPHDITKFNNPSRTPRDLTELHRIRRPGSVVQPPSVHVIDFDMMKANDILKYGTKVQLGDKQLLEHTYEDENGQLQTKKLSELSFDLSKKLSELHKITALGSNVPLDDKMNVLNTMIQEISGKFNVLSSSDMKNISRIVHYMGDDLKTAENINLPRFLTSKGFAKELKDDEARMTMFLSGKLEDGYLATKGQSNTKIIANEELIRYMENPTALYNLDKLIVVTTPDWNTVKVTMNRPENRGQKIDGYEYDDHPNTLSLKTRSEEKKQVVADRVAKLELKERDRQEDLLSKRDTLDIDINKLNISLREIIEKIRISTASNDNRSTPTTRKRLDMDKRAKKKLIKKKTNTINKLDKINENLGIST
jgi:hypothetical protein